MNPTPFVAVSLLATFVLCISAQNALAPNTPDPGAQDKAPTQSPKPIAMKVWNIEDVIAKHRAAKRSYTRFFRVPSTDCGIYTLPKGGKDNQTPHANDELYYVVKGKAKLQCDGKKVDLKPGSLVFIGAAAEHRFVDIEEDLELLVVFSSGVTQAAAAAAKKKDAAKKKKG
jgi:mannose-6-phosphate isomerase-like protein (cupin superfamily)